MPMRLCSYCQKEFPFIWSGKKLSDGSKLYTDSEGRRWSGRRCPHCERRRVVTSVQTDQFTKKGILQKLRSSGMTIDSENLPIKASLNGKQFTVGVRRAHTENGTVILESQVEEDCDLVAIVFESVRICPREQLKDVTFDQSIQSKNLASTRSRYREPGGPGPAMDNPT